MSGMDVVNGLRARHARSPQPSSKMLVATIDAVNETIALSGHERSVVACFGACMSALERADARESPESVAALCTLLSTAMQHLPGQLLRSKFTTVSAILLRTYQGLTAAGHAAGRRAALPCLVLALRNVDPSTTWAPVTGPFAALLKGTMDGSPKVRKVAVNGLAEVLASVRGTAAMQPASADLASVCKVVLSAPKLAAKAAAEATKSARPAAEAAIMAAVQDCLHFLGALRPVMPVLAEAAALDVAEQLLSLFLLAQPLLSQHAADCLLGLAQGAANTNNVSASRLQLLLKAALPLLASQREADTQIRLVAFVEAACAALARMHPPAAMQALPAAVDRLHQLLASPSDGVRRAASEALLAVIRACVTPELVRSANVDAARGSGAPGALARAVAALAATLQPSCSAIWHLSLPVAAEMLRALGPDGGELAKLLIAPLAALCRGSADADEATSLAHAALGAAIGTQGPALVMQVVPLDMSDLMTCDLWLIPLLRKHTCGSSMAFWGEYFMPRARHVGSLAMRLGQTGAQKEQVLKLKALELQLWCCLASFASWAPDVPAAFAAFGDSVLAAFQKRDDLQAPICNALARICTQTASVLRAEAEPEAGTVVAENDSRAPEDYGADTARSNLECLRERSAQWMPQLLERFTTSAPEERGQLGDSIGAYATAVGTNHTAPHFKACLGKLVQSLQRLQAPDQSAAVNAEADFCTALELTLRLAPGMPDAAMEPLFKATTLALALAQPAAQKKAYKALAYVAEHRPAVLRARFAGICAVLLDTKAVQAAARRHRLACLTPIVTLLMGPAPPDLAGVALPEGTPAGESPAHAVVSALITELVLCTKEVNAKTRSEAYDVLVRLARAMHAAQPPEHSMEIDDGPTNLRNGGLQRLFAMVLAGLASTTPRMVSAAVMALTRITFEFGPELQLIVSRLLPAVCTLLHKKAREVIKSVLGFLKVAVMRVPAELLAPHLRAMVEGVLVWAEDTKNRYKLKVRHLVERLCKRCGYDAVAAVWPESQEKLLTAIRKHLARKARRKAGRAGDDSDDGAPAGADARSHITMARTARASEWGHTAVFSDDEETAAGAAGDTRSAGGRTATTRRGAVTVRTGTTARGRRAAAQLAEDPDTPADLLDMATSRALARSAAGVPEEEPAVDDFARDALGKMVIAEEPSSKGGERRQRGKGEEEDVFATPWRKRRRPAAGDSDDSDAEGEAGVFGLKRAMQQTEGAQSLKRASKYAHSQQTARTRRTAATSVVRGSRADSAAKFKARSAAGDVKGGSKVDPYSYWKLDRNLLNPRAKKKREAASKLGSAVVTGAPARGSKARKRARAAPDL